MVKWHGSAYVSMCNYVWPQIKDQSSIPVQYLQTPTAVGQVISMVGSPRLNKLQCWKKIDFLVSRKATVVTQVIS